MRAYSAILMALSLLGAACTERPADAPPATAAVGGSVAAPPDKATWLPSPTDSLVGTVVLRIEPLPPDSTQLSPGSLVLLADSTQLELPVHDAQLVYALRATQGAHWLLLRGHECTACDAPERVWVFRTPPNAITTRYQRFPLPGAWMSADDAGDDDKPYFRSRMFVGSCLAEADAVAVWIEETLKPDADRRHEVRVLRGTPQLQDTTFAWSADLQSEVEERTRTGACREVPPRDQITL